MNEVNYLNESNFDAEVLESPVPVLVVFTSVLCSPCQRLKPVLDELADDLGNTGKVVAVEITVNEGLSERYGIAALPTLIVVRNGKEIHRLVGLKTREYLLEALAA
jgi:thioredoxin 1